MDYVPVLILMAAGFIVGGAAIFISWLLGPRMPNSIKETAFECGVPSTDGAKTRRMSVRFYLVAILFLLFDVETVFFYPWAVVYKKFLAVGPFIFIEMLLFIAVLMVGYLYVIRKGALDWD